MGSVLVRPSIKRQNTKKIHKQILETKFLMSLKLLDTENQ